ncbi:thioesterase family protein [Cupriavidus respiraculi]|uniref:Fluoroacetyl-CoA thioesterase n=1 Tax=Cupriavidus respiraculi TaxID=195930 RepID=A0ABN7YR73_9BURK|nr:thioesterase family protein [Cupriavidus respiraculi]MBY4946317.1 thioesterase family protein [Cupriavidus respiraculi]CAG9175865.1 Fluoroacetyl-CoA thioesterase [Cupriavidus respiraculi]
MTTRPPLAAGQTFTWQYTVPPKATVPNLYDDIPGCADMPDVLATGYMVGIMECACLQMLLEHLDWPREQSLGTLVSFSHLAPTPAGMTITVKGELVAIEGRKLRFELSAWDGEDKISEGVHERHLIDAARFNDRLAAKVARQQESARG